MKRRRYILIIAGLLLAVSFGAIAYAAHRIEHACVSAVKSDLDSLPHERVGLVLGCGPVLRTGAPNPFFENRIAAAAAVFQAHKVDYVLLSGDNHKSAYDEPTAMKNALVQLGIPENRLVLDYAGFSTLDSVVRAKKVFGLSELCIITQKDHAMRALYIARANGLEAVAFPAKDLSMVGGLRTHVRESLARVRTLLDVHILGRKPHFLGTVIEIGKNG